MALLLSNIRESGAPIKQIENQSSGIIPVMKLLEDSFSYANQLGARQGAGAVYLNAHHPDIMRFLDTKRENADEKIRIKTLSLGVVVPDITFELAKNDEDMYLFSPYDVEKVYGVPFGDISVTEKYREMVDDPRIKKTKINAREFFQTIAEIQFESGYPYIMFEDTVNRANPIKGRINMSNLCSEILQVNTPTTYNEDLSYNEIGKDISCNLGSMNIALAMDGRRPRPHRRDRHPRPHRGEQPEPHRLGPLHRGRQRPLARDRPRPDEPARLPRPRARPLRVRRGHRLHEHLLLHGAVPRAPRVEPHRDRARPGVRRVRGLDVRVGGVLRQVHRPGVGAADREGQGAVRRHPHPDAGGLDGAEGQSIQQHGIYNQNLQAVPPTGSISYINNSTSSIHPIASKIEIRKEGKLGRVYYPAPFMTNDNLEYYEDAYEIGYEKVIDTYAAATQHVDQGLSLTLFFKDTVDDARHQQGADLRVAQGHQDDLLHPPAADGARGHRAWPSASAACSESTDADN